MELGDPAERAARSPLDVLLNKPNDNLNQLLETVESGGLDHLDAAEKISWWQRFETFRNRLPLIDHRLIANAEATDLASTYGFTNLSRFLTRIRAATPRGGDNREGAGCGAGHAQTHPRRFGPRSCADRRTPAQRLRAGARPTDLHRYALRVVDAADPDGPAPVDEHLQHDRRYLELKQRRDGMWHLQGKLTTTLGAQLNAILDPLSKPRTSSIETTTGPSPRLPISGPTCNGCTTH
jgi:hypothetical protein